MYSVIDINATILVTRESNNFVIKDLATGQTVVKKASLFYGNLYKYESDFLRSFKKAFGSRKIKNLLLSYEASDYITDLISFNRIDS